MISARFSRVLPGRTDSDDAMVAFHTGLGLALDDRQQIAPPPE
jgi:hypothetical protein